MTDDARDQARTDHESQTRRGEDVAKEEQEAGRQDTGVQGATERPMGTSTARDFTGVDPKEVTSHDDEDRSPAG